MKIVVIIGSICLLLAGCQSEEKLSREKAFRLISQEMKFPKVYAYDVFCGDTEHAKKLLDAGMENEGLVSVKRTQKVADIGQPIIEFTEKASPYLLPASAEEKKTNIQKVKIADEDLIEITGIKLENDGKSAVVEYSTGYKNITPFATLVRTDLTKPTTRTAYFALYDDGWRLERKN
jgi:hypothetical protein